jgi:hypothetical protein
MQNPVLQKIISHCQESAIRMNLRSTLKKSMQGHVLYFGPIDGRAKRPFHPMIILQPKEIRSRIFSMAK